MRNRILELHGAENLALAGKMLLECPELDLAVVRGVSDPIEEDTFNTAFGMEHEERVKRFYEEVPSARQLDEEVEKWGSDPEARLAYAPLRLLPGLQIAFPRRSAILPHIDIPSRWPVIDGPLTLSYRYDGTPTSRIYYAKRMGSLTITGGAVEAPYDANENGFFHRTSSYYDLASYSRVEQHSGDIVITANHPYAAAHAVETPNTSEATQQPRTLIVSYAFAKD